MDDLIIRSLTGEASAEEARELIRWRAADPRNDAYYRSLAEAWELGRYLEPGPALRPSAAEIVNAAEREDRKERAGRRGRVRPGSSPGSPSHRRRLGRAALAAAAVLATVLVTGVLWQAGEPAGTPVVQEEAPDDGPRTVRLADGSVAHLAPGTVLERYEDDPRRVRLEGRAYFGITHQPDWPFVVETDAGTTRVLGTRFDMTASAGEMTVVVVEGRVEVVSDSQEVEIGPGQESRVVDGGAPVVGLADVARVTGWLGDVFIFQATPLSEVARELEQRFDRTIVIADPALEDRTITAVYSHPTLDEILPTICRAVGARCESTGRTIRISTESHPR